MRKKFGTFLLLFCVPFLIFQFAFIPSVKATAVTVYSVDPCETTGQWQVIGTNLVAPLLNSALKVQGSSSVSFAKYVVGVGNWYGIANDSFMTFPSSSGDIVLGAWIYVDSSASHDMPVDLLVVNTANGHSVSFGIYYYSGWKLSFSVSGTTSYSGNVGISAGSWYWAEIKWISSTKAMDCHLNGTHVGGGIGYNCAFFTANNSMVVRVSGVWNAVTGDNKKYFDYIRLASDFEFPPSMPISVDIDAENIDDYGADWVFTDWRYYTFSASVQSYAYTGAIDWLGLRFNVSTFNGSLSCYIWHKGDIWESAISPSLESRDLEPIRLKIGSNSSTVTSTTVNFPIWFTTKCLDVYEPGSAISIQLAFNDTAGTFNNWAVADGDTFRIYNKGGFSQNLTKTGTYVGMINGGEHFAFYGENNTYIYRDQWFRDVQHMKLLPEVQFYAGYQTFYISYGVDYAVGNGSWLEGLKCTIGASFVSWTGIFASNVWINMTIAWWNRGVYIKTDNVYMFYHGNAGATGDPGKFRFWVDFWFNSINASSTLGGRINAYEYPMEDSSAVWLRWLSSNWGVKDNVTKESEVLMPLLDSAGAVMSSERIQMVRYWSSLEVVPYTDNQAIFIENFDVVDLTQSKSLPLTGIQTPVFDETKMPVVGNSGILGAIWSMFAGIGKWIGDNILFGGLALWPTFVSFMDTIAGWFGLPNGFTNLMTWLGGIWAGFVSGVTYLMSLIYDFFLLLAQLGATFIYMLGAAVSSIITFIGYFLNFMAGGFTVGVNLWNTFGISTWITVFLIFYPMYLVILWDQKGYKAVIDQLMFIWGIVDRLGHFLFNVLNTLINLISGLVESVPVVE